MVADGRRWRVLALLLLGCVVVPSQVLGQLPWLFKGEEERAKTGDIGTHQARRQLLAIDHPLVWTFPQLIDPAAQDSYPPLSVAVGDTVTFEWPQDSTSPHGVVLAPSAECPPGDDFSGPEYTVLAPIEPAGRVTWTAQNPGTFHFICQESGHCSGGMVITVNVGGPAPAEAPAQVPTAAAGGSPQGSAGGGTNHPLLWTFPQLIDPAATESYPPMNVAVGDTVTFEWPQDSTSPHGVVLAPSDQCPPGNDFSGPGFTELAPIEPAGSVTWAAESPGTFHFICQEAGHCSGGMVITINVGAAAGEAPEPSTAAAAQASPPAGSRDIGQVASVAGGGGEQSSEQAPAASATGANCGLSVAGTMQTFASCSSLQGAGSEYNLLWTMEPASGNGESVLSLAIESPSSGWVGWGIPAEAGEMVGASAIIVRADAASPTGATAQSYYLGGKSSSAITPASRLNFGNITASSSNGQLTSTFTLTLPSAQVEGGTPIIFAEGPLSGSGGYGYHGANRAPGNINFATGQAAVTTDSSTGSYNRKLWAHGWVATIGLGVLLPLGIVLAKLFKSSRAWRAIFWVHVLVQVLGVIMGFVTAGLGAQLDVTDHLRQVHRKIGITVIAVAGFQVIAAFLWRPGGDSQHRWLFQMHHWLIGRAVACLAIANVYIGLHQVQPFRTWRYYVAYSVVIGVLFLAWLVKGLVSWRHEALIVPRPSRGRHGSKGGEFIQSTGNGHRGDRDGYVPHEAA